MESCEICGKQDNLIPNAVVTGNSLAMRPYLPGGFRAVARMCGTCNRSYIEMGIDTYTTITGFKVYLARKKVLGG